MTTVVFILSVASTMLSAGQVPGLSAGQAPAQLMHSRILDQLAQARPAPWLPLQAAALQTEAIQPAVVAGLASPSSVVVARAAFVAGEARCQDCRKLLATVLTHPDRTVRLHAGIALCRLGDPRGVDAAAAALLSARPWLKYYAIVGLWQVGSRRAREIVSRATNDPAPLVAYAATAAIGSWEAARSKPAKLSSPTLASLGEDAIDFVVNALIAESDWWWHKGRYEQCIRCNEAVTFLAPDAEEMYTNSAWLLWSMGRHSEAIGTYHRCIANNPHSSHGPFYLGFYYMQHGDLAAAEKYLSLAVAKSPTDHLARRALAHCLEKQGRLREALQQWEELRRQRSTDGSVLLNIRRLQKKIRQQNDP